MHNQKKDNNKFKNKKQLELLENQTVWKSDNQGVKEETSIQTDKGAEMGIQADRTGSKAAARGPGRGASWHLEDQATCWLVDKVVAHFHEDKLGGTTGE